MKKTFLTLTLMGTTFFTSLNTFAAPDDQQRNDSPRPEHRERESRSGPDHRGHNTYKSRDERTDHAWRKGQRVPNQYKSSRYSVEDWKHRSLPAPPRGQRWINVNGDYILIAVATGVISSILFNQH